MSDTEIHRRGRPSKAEQLEIQKKIWPYFEEGYSVGRTTKETGLNIKTVRKYFRIWYSKYISVQGPDFFNNCRLSNGRTILELGSRISKLEIREDELDVAIQSSGLIHDKRWMYAEYRKTQELLSKLYLEKNNLENTPTADVLLKIERDEIIKDLEDGQRKDGDNAT